MLLIGIDPGLDGAVCWLRDREFLVFDMPTLTITRDGRKKRDVDMAQLDTLLRDADHAILEKSWSRPDDGAAFAFTFGKGYGAILGILTARAVPVDLVSPATWKKGLRVNTGKDEARQRASELFPAHAHHWKAKAHHNRAEAALIAEYGRRLLNGGT